MQRKQQQQKQQQRNSKRGSRQVTAPASRAFISRNVGPKINGGDSFRITHREMIHNVLGTEGYTNHTFLINPGNELTFPWLNTTANNWEMYKFHKLSFEYLPICPTDTRGVVTYYVDYDVYDPFADGTIEAAANFGAVQGAPWVKTSSVLNKKAMFPLGDRKYTDDGNIVSIAEDEKTIFVGNLHISTDYFTAAIAGSSVGHIWVNYDVEFFVPQSPHPKASGSSTFIRSDSNNHELVTTVETAEHLSQVVLSENGVVSNDALTGYKIKIPGTYETTYGATYNDDASEAFNCVNVIKKNGSIIPGAIATVASAVGGYLKGTITTIQHWNVDDVVQFAVTLTGVAGTLIRVADQGYLKINRL